MDDLDAVRAALGYRQLDVLGSSYGATAAQIYLKLHPASVRTLILSGATAIDVLRELRRPTLRLPTSRPTWRGSSPTPAGATVPFARG